MSIQKITENELLSYGVRSLPNRPSSPTLYSGKTLSAAELKAAFDRLPTLVAERFNALLEATGLFDSAHPSDRLAELIATDISPYHSLADFFEDVKNGNLALYLSADGKTALADVLSEMKADILALENRSFAVEGEGDILTDAEIDGPFVTLRRDLSSTALLEEAKAYTDALEKKHDMTATQERISLLEEAARGILYSYPVTDVAKESFRADTQVLKYATILRLGGVIELSQNIFPEKLLTTFQSDTLSITWDDEEQCLVFNGTLDATSSLLTIAPFRAPACNDDYTASIFPRSGSVSSPFHILLHFYTEDGQSVPLSFSHEPYTISSLLNTSKNRFHHIALESFDIITFENYKCNICLQRKKVREATYLPFNAQALPSPFVRTVSVKGPNEWTAERSKTGKGGVTFFPPKVFTDTTLIISYITNSDNPNTTRNTLYIYLEDGTRIRKLKPQGQRVFEKITLKSPLVRLEFLPIETTEMETDYTITVKDLQVEYSNEKLPAVYSAPFSDTLSLPESFSRYASVFYGTGDALCNYFDLEHGMFVKEVSKLTLDGSLCFCADENIPNRFRAPFATPDTLLTKGYRPYAIFDPLTDEENCDECLWFTDTEVIVQSTLFSTAEDINTFFARQSIDVIYGCPTEKEFLTPEERESCTLPLLSLVPEATVSLLDAEGNPCPTFVRMQYQRKNSTEETE